MKKKLVIGALVFVVVGLAAALNGCSKSDDAGTPQFTLKSSFKTS